MLSRLRNLSALFLPLINCFFLLPFVFLLEPGALAAVTGTTTALSVGPSVSVAFQQPVTLTATIADASGNPVLHGSVTFLDGTRTLGTTTIISNSSAGFTPGTAIYRTRALSQGGHSLTAKFAGTITDAASTSGVVAVTITAAAGPYATATQLTSTTDASGGYDLTATVGGFGPFSPTNSVTFSNETTSTSLGSQSLAPDSAAFLASGVPTDMSHNLCTISIPGDFNNDGNLDVLTVSDAGQAPTSCYQIETGKLAVLLGNGNGTFTERSSAAVSGLTTEYLAPLAVADINGDGNLDVVGSSLDPNDPLSSALSVYLGKGDGTFSAPVTIAANYQANYAFDPVVVTTSDFNGDGIPDLAYSTKPFFRTSTGFYSELGILLGRGDGTFSETDIPLSITCAGTEGCSYPLAGDFDNDGKTDLVMIGRESIMLLSGNDDGTFQNPATYSVALNSQSTEFNLVAGLTDLTGNGSQQIIWLQLGDNGVNGSLNVLTYRGGAFSNTSYSLPGYAVPPDYTGNRSAAQAALAFGDFNYDGKPDVAVYNAMNGQILVFAGKGDGSLQPLPTIQALPGSSQGFLQMAEGDFTNNGNPDLAVFDAASSSFDFLQPAQTAVATLSGITVSLCGLQQVNASYAGDVNFGSSKSSPVALDQENGTPTLSIASGVPAAIETGTPFSVTTHVTSSCAGGAVPTGTVMLQVNSGDLAQGSLSGNPPSYSGTINTPAQPIAVGPQSITASYSGDANWLPAKANVPVIIQGTTSVLISYTGSSTVLSGSTITMVAKVSSNQPGVQPTGTVTLLDNGKPIAVASLPSSSFTVNSTSAPLTAGANVFSVSYSGDGSWAGSTSGSLTINIQPTDTATFTANLPSSYLAFPGASVQFTLRVTPYGNGSPTGTVQFYDGASSIGAPVPLISGTASFSSTSFAVGSHSVSAKYSGDATYHSLTSSAINFTIITHATLTLQASTEPAGTVDEGSNFTVFATLNETSPVLGPKPSGTLTLTINGTPGPSLTENSCLYCVFGVNVNSTTNHLPLGTNYLSWSYSGDSYWDAAKSSIITVNVVQGPLKTPTLTLTSNLSGYSSVVQGTPVTFTAKVAGSAGTPSGTVQFYSGGTALGGPVTLSNGVAMFTTSALPAGSDTVTAAYSGSTDYSSATTSGVVTVVTQGPDTLSLALGGPSTVTLGVPVTLKGTVATGALGPAPTGEVSLLDTNTVIASAMLSGNNPATATFTVNTAGQPLAVRQHSFTLRYAGSAQWAASTASGATVTITQPATTTTLTSSAASLTAGTSLTLTARVSSTLTSPTPTGQVQFYDGTTSLGSPVALVGGAAAYTTAALSGGDHSIKAVYSGDSNFATSTSEVLSESIEDFTFASSSPSATVVPGAPATFTLTVTSQGGLDASTSFACSGLPTGAACSFSPQTVTGTGKTTLTITTQGSQALAVPAHAGPWLARAGAFFACALWLMVPGRRGRKQLGLLIALVVLLPVLAIGCGGGGMTSSSGGSSGGGGSSGSTGSGGTPAGTYTIAVTATSGSGASALSQTAKISLTVQ